MSIYHMNISIIGRSKGKSAVAAAAYRSAQSLREDETGIQYDFSRKHFVAHSEILLPPQAPARFSDRTILWNSVQEAEKNKNAQLSREFEMAFPNEISFEDAKEIARRFCIEQLVGRGMCADMNIHWKPGNHHVHILTTLRSIKEDGTWAPKAKKVYDLNEAGERIYQKTDKDGRKVYKSHKEDYNDWNNKENVEIWRKAWADICNEYLDESTRIDHRSYARQGIDIEPTIHEGFAARKLEEGQNPIESERLSINREIKERNAVRKLITGAASPIRIEIDRKIEKIKEALEVYEQRYSAARKLDKTDRGIPEFGFGSDPATGTGYPIVGKLAAKAESTDRFIERTEHEIARTEEDIDATGNFITDMLGRIRDYIRRKWDALMEKIRNRQYDYDEVENAIQCHESNIEELKDDEQSQGPIMM